MNDGKVTDCRAASEAPGARRRAARNRTLTLTAEERTRLVAQLARPETRLSPEDWADRLFCGDFFALAPLLPPESVDLLIIDPPYNRSKDFGTVKTRRAADVDYEAYLDRVVGALLPLLKPDASIYCCGDWVCSAAQYRVLDRYFTVRNRITWQREKGRGAGRNWKNAAEDIWFATVGGDYCFNVDAVKQKRRVLAPYRENGRPKDWAEEPGGRFRLTCPGNFWDDITVPYWSMPENTDHPTQKPEKLLAKLILASSREGGLVFDPFAGSGSTLVTARKLNRRFAGVEIHPEYCLWALKRLELALHDRRIQGYDGVFMERNSMR